MERWKYSREGGKGGRIYKSARGDGFTQLLPRMRRGGTYHCVLLSPPADDVLDLLLSVSGYIASTRAHTWCLGVADAPILSPVHPASGIFRPLRVAAFFLCAHPAHSALNPGDVDWTVPEPTWGRSSLQTHSSTWEPGLGMSCKSFLTSARPSPPELTSSSTSTSTLANGPNFVASTCGRRAAR